MSDADDAKSAAPIAPDGSQSSDSGITMMPEQVAEVPGLLYWPRFISRDGEQMIISSLLANPLWVGVTASARSRRVIHYGYKYDYSRTKSLSPTVDIPGLFAAIMDLPHWGPPLVKFDQLIINEYVPGQGISPHVDEPRMFGDVVFCITIGSGTMITFTHPDGRVVHKYVTPGSAYAMTSDARYTWKHAIEPAKSDVVAGKKINRGTRYSLTFRTVRRR